MITTRTGSLLAAEAEGPLPLVFQTPYSAGLPHLPFAGLVSAVSRRLPGFLAEFSQPRPASHCEGAFFFLILSSN